MEKEIKRLKTLLEEAFLINEILIEIHGFPILKKFNKKLKKELQK